LLHRFGNQVCSVKNADLTALKRAGEDIGHKAAPVDILFTDIKLPGGMDGST
jgi:hypothetical protein